ncbi:glycosyltransferase [Turicibacter sanguinis]|nr:glycosyltransferase [Turicibacter sanguinis]
MNEVKAIRVLHCVGVMNRGGAETLIMNIYRNIDRKKVQFDFLVHHQIPGAYDDEIRALGGNIYYVPYGIKSLHFRYIEALKKCFKNHKEISVVHSHMSDASGIICSIAKKAGIPVRIAHSHIANPNHNLIQKIYLGGYSRTKISESCTHYFSCSKGAGEYLFNKSINDMHLKIIKNGIDIKAFLPDKEIGEKIKSELDITNKIVFGHVGRFEKQKNHLFLLEVFSEIYKKNPNTVLLLVGGSALDNDVNKKKIEMRIIELGIVDGVKLLGVREDVNYILKAVDLIIFPSLYEGLPLTLIESQVSGVKCLVADTITKEVDLGIGGIEFLPLNNQRAWIDKVEELLNSIHSPSKEFIREKVIESGYDIIQTAKWLECFYIDSVEEKC